jgi:SPP1 gp7 family putative phage head morphogenesis protein
MSNLEKSAEIIEKLLDERIEGSERAIAKRYAHLLYEIRKEIARLFELYEKDGVLTYEEMAKYDRLKKFLAYINTLLAQNYKDLKTILYQVLSEVYQEGYYRTAWAIETESLSRLAYSTVTPETITAMIENPITGLTLSETLQKNRTAIIYKIQQEITQGLVKGESYKTMATRLKQAIEVDATKAMRIVRTEAHRVSESAKHDSAEHANKNGVIMVKTWNSVGDEKVRHSTMANHRKLNGKTIPIDQDFEQGRGKGKGPGMMLAPEHDINDRCFLTYSIKKVEQVDAKELENMAFETWKKERLKNG